MNLAIDKADCLMGILRIWILEIWVIVAHINITESKIINAVNSETIVSPKARVLPSGVIPFTRVGIAGELKPSTFFVYPKEVGDAGSVNMGVALTVGHKETITPLTVDDLVTMTFPTVC